MGKGLLIMDNLDFTWLGFEEFNTSSLISVMS